MLENAHNFEMSKSSQITEILRNLLRVFTAFLRVFTAFLRVTGCLRVRIRNFYVIFT